MEEFPGATRCRATFTHLPVERNTSMVSILRRAIALVALAVGVGVAAGAVPAAAATAHHTAATHSTTHSGAANRQAFAQPSDWWF